MNLENIKKICFSKYSIFFLIGFIFLLKLYFSLMGFSSFEGLFHRFAYELAFTTPIKDLHKSIYFYQQANPIGLSLLIAFFYKITSFMDIKNFETLSRLPTILTFVGFMFILNNLLDKNPFKNYSLNKKCILISLISFHPSIWLFSNRALSDCIYFCLTTLFLMFVIIYLESNQKKFLYFSFAALFTSVFFKFNIIIPMGIACLLTLLYYFEKNRDKYKNILSPLLDIKNYKLPATFILLFALSFLFYLGVSKYLQVPYRSNKFDNVLLQVSPLSIFRNFELYGVHNLMVNIVPYLIILSSIIKDTGKKVIRSSLFGASILTIFFAIFFSSNSMFEVGELNFGSFFDLVLIFTSVIWFWPVLFLNNFILTLLGIKFFKPTTPIVLKILFLITVASLLVHSPIRPVQRYIFYLIPITLIISFELFKESALLEKRKLLIAFIVLQFVACFTISHLRSVKNNAYKALSEKILESSDAQIYNDPYYMGFIGGYIPFERFSSDQEKSLCVYKFWTLTPMIKLIKYDFTKLYNIKVSYDKCGFK